MDYIKSLLSQKEVVKWSAFWFGANLTITFFNKYALSGLKIAPTINTFSHLGLTFLGSCIANKFEFPNLNRSEYSRLFLYSFIFSFNIVYSQYGMKLTSLSLNQVTRATTPIYQAFLEYMLMSREHKIYNLIPLIPVIFGVAMTSLGDLKVTMLGLFVSISSVFISALKGVLSMKLLQKDLKSKIKEYTFLMIVAPMAIVWIMIFEFLIRQSAEGGLIWYITGGTTASAANAAAVTATTAPVAGKLMDLPLKYLFIGGCLAFLTNVASFGTVSRTSATAMGVMANAKQALIILIAMFLAEKDWTPLKLFGVMVTICGAVWYSYRKEKTRKKQSGSSDTSNKESNNETPANQRQPLIFNTTNDNESTGSRHSNSSHEDSASIIIDPSIAQPNRPTSRQVHK